MLLPVEVSRRDPLPVARPKPADPAGWRSAPVLPHPTTVRARAAIRHTGVVSWGEVVLAASTVVIPGAIGAGAALAVQRLANRAQSAESRVNRRMQKRTELRDSIHAFLDAVQAAESFADPASVPRSERADSAARHVERNELLHKMWFRKRALEVGATAELEAAAETLTVTMRDVMFGNLPDGQDMWEYLDGPRTAFMRCAHDALYDED